MKLCTAFPRAAVALAALILFFAMGTMAQTTNGLSDAEIQGRQLAQQLCDTKPVASFTNSGVLQIRRPEGVREQFRFCFQILFTETNWLTTYETTSESYRIKFLIVHNQSGNQCFELRGNDKLPAESTAAFASSDFWLCDLGLEFFHWPAQKVLKKEIKRSRGCTVLESTNPNPSTNGYSRVVSWIDGESGGIVQAEAYDFNGKLLKEFAPKSFKKVNGQWELQEMEIRNVQTGSRTRLAFDLNK